MQRLRQRWVVLLGGALIVTLTVSTAFGADPADALDDPRGRTIAGFVHSLVFGEDAPSDEPQDEEETLEDDELDEELEDERSPETDDVSGAAHGACVSEVARNKGAIGGPNDNHGGAVGEAARETRREAADAGAAEVESAESAGGGNGKGRGNGRGGRP